MIVLGGRIPTSLRSWIGNYKHLASNQGDPLEFRPGYVSFSVPEPIDHLNTPSSYTYSSTLL